MSTPQRSGKQMAADLLQNAYSKGSINASELKDMTKKLGID